MNAAIGRWIVTSVIAIAALAHVFVDSVSVNTVGITLLAMMYVPWAGLFFSKLEIPGVLTVEGRELRKAVEPIAAGGLFQRSRDRDSQRRRRHTYAFEAVAGGDRNMVLAGLSMELQRRLQDIAKSKGITAGGKSLHSVVDQLAHQGVIRREEASAISDLLPLLNKAVHGANVDRAAVEWALDFGVPLLDALDEHLGQSSIPELLTQWRHRDGALSQEVGTELSKALVKTPRAFFKAMANDPDSFDSWLKDISTHTFTVLESEGELEDDLYTAYYEKLKSLMEDRLRNLLGTEVEKEALRVLSALSDVSISRIL